MSVAGSVTPPVYHQLSGVRIGRVERAGRDGLSDGQVDAKLSQSWAIRPS